MNRKGEKILTIWRIFIILVVGGAVAGSVLIVYYADVNIDYENAEILAERLVDCFRDYSGSEIDVYSYCGLDKSAFEKGNLFFRVRVDSQEFKGGNYAFEKDCLISLSGEAENYPECVLVEKGNLDILVGVRQKGFSGGLG